MFITGTDTGVGKTHVTCCLLEALVRSGETAIGYKPVACGDRSDALAIQAACGGPPQVPLERINPLWLRAPAAPMAAAMIENRPIDPDSLERGYRTLEGEFPHILVEGAGGWEVPITASYSMADLAVALGLPVLVVVDNKLGALNHTLLTVAAVRARGLACAGIVLNYASEERDSASISNRALLEQLLPKDVPVLDELLHGQEEMELPERLIGHAPVTG